MKSSPEHPIVYTLHYYLSAGFGCEVLNLAYAIHYFREQKLFYKIISTTWISSVNRGWQDYFASLQIEHQLDSVHLKRLEKLLKADRWLERHLTPRIFYAFRKIAFPRVKHLIQSSPCYYRGSKLEEIARQFCYQQRKSDYQRFRHAMWRIVSVLWKPLPHIVARIPSYMPPQTPYACIHIRRGDKVAIGEDDFFPIENYFAALTAFAPDIKVVYLMSDDFRVFHQACERFPDYHICQGPEHRRRGYDQSSFEAARLDEVREQTENLILDLEIARQSKVFIGTFKSHLFRLVEFLRDENGIDISSRDRPNSHM